MTIAFSEGLMAQTILVISARHVCCISMHPNNHSHIRRLPVRDLQRLAVNGEKVCRPHATLLGDILPKALPALEAVYCRPHPSRAHFRESPAADGKKKGTSTCVHCQFFVRNSIPENFVRHLLQCNKCPPSVRTDMEGVVQKAHVAAETKALKKAGGSVGGSSPGTTARKRLRVEVGSTPVVAVAVGQGASGQLDMLLLQWLIASDLPFDSVSNPAFLALASALRPSWRPPGGPYSLRLPFRMVLFAAAAAAAA